MPRSNSRGREKRTDADQLYIALRTLAQGDHKSFAIALQDLAEGDPTVTREALLDLMRSAIELYAIPYSSTWDAELTKRFPGAKRRTELWPALRVLEDLEMVDEDLNLNAYGQKVRQRLFLVEVIK